MAEHPCPGLVRVLGVLKDFCRQVDSPPVALDDRNSAWNRDILAGAKVTDRHRFGFSVPPSNEHTMVTRDFDRPAVTELQLERVPHRRMLDQRSRRSKLHLESGGIECGHEHSPGHFRGELDSPGIFRDWLQMQGLVVEK